MVISAPVAFLGNAPHGTRVVVRYVLHNQPEGATDVRGYLSAASDTECVVATAQGLVTITFSDVIAAKEIPPPPARRAP
ncbi:MAG: hypothetical protein ACOH1J_01570 [Microbacteriaceae bacterium]